MIKNFKQFEDITKETTIFKNSVPVTNNPVILNTLVNYQIKAYRNKEKDLSRNLIEELTNLFGTPNKSLRLEFMTKLWFLKYKDLTFNIFTAKIDFLETLYSLINNI